MKLLRRGRQLGLAVRNAGRFREIVRVFARHGFSEILVRMNLDRFLPGRFQAMVEAQAEVPTPTRLRLAFEELGPSFVKLGQVLATRPDILPETYTEELTKLQDNVRSLPFAAIREVVERELGKPLSEAFLSFDETPIAAASIAQVHGAVLPGGRKVVVKVQRPGISRVISQDIALMESLAALLERYVPESRILAPAIFVDEFFRTLKQELDFKVEANNIRKISENLKDFKDVKLPEVFASHSTHQILTMERFEGIPLNNMVAIRSSGADLKRLNEIGARAFFHTVMKDGLFHGDLHGGNIFLLPDNRLGIIDFGIVGRLSERSRSQLSSMVLAIITEDFEALCYQYAELGSAGPSVDFDGFQREVRNTLSPYLGLKAEEVNSGAILIQATRIAGKYQIRVPGDWMIVFRALFTVEGLARSLDPHFDMIELGRDLVKDIVKSQYSPERIAKDGLWIAKDFLSLAQVLPRQIRWALRKWNADGYAFELKSPDLQAMTEQVAKNGRRTKFSVLSAGLFVASAIALHAQDPHSVLDYPLSAVVFFVLALYFWWRS